MRTVLKGACLSSIVLGLIACGGGSEGGGKKVSDTQNSAQIENSVPVANADGDQDVVTGTVVILSGTSSTDADGDTLSYQWSLIAVPAGSAAILSNASAVSPTFTADVDGSYIAQLVVNDGSDNSAPDIVTIVSDTASPDPADNPDVDSGNENNSTLVGRWLLPCDAGVRRGFQITGTTADLLHRFYEYDDCAGIGTDVTLASFDLTVGESLTTDSGLEADQIDLTYTSEPTELDTYVQGDTIYTIIGTDDSGSNLYFGEFADSPDTRPSALNLLDAYAHNAAGNMPPVAQAGSDRTVSSGSTVTLNGSGSFDSDGSLIDYRWMQTGGPSVSLENANSAIASFTLPQFTISEELMFTLTVTDNSGVSVIDNVTITTVEEDAQSYPDLDAEFTMRIEGPIGTTGGYLNNPVTIEFGTSNDHFQNYSPSPKFSWGYHSSGDLTEEEMNSLSDEDFTVFSTQETHRGLTFTYELDELYPNTEIDYFYFRLVIERPDGSLVRHTKKAVFPMVRAQGYLEVDGTIYPLGREAFKGMPLYEEHSRITFTNAEPIIGSEYLPYTIIDIPWMEGIFPEYVRIEIAAHFPSQSLPVVYYQLGDNPYTYLSSYSRKGFYVTFGEYSTFDDPSGHYSSGGWALHGTAGHPDIQGSLSLDMTLRGSYGDDETDEIQAKLRLDFITRDDLNIWD